ncbi:MAG: TonB-dependent receptor [Bacteroidota bacterium]|nr:TonB-dependent receptor [Bacteroidota bacterium]
MLRYIWWVLLLAAGPAAAQSWGRVSGEVIDAERDSALFGVNVVVAGTDFGTSTDPAGRYALQLPAGRHALQFSFVGFTPFVDTIIVASRIPVILNVRLMPGIMGSEEIVVEERAPLEAGVQRLTPEQVRFMPSPFKGYQALLVLPGVSSSNELSNQYSVRGGGFNENLIFLNGFEIHMPFRPRQGEQEGIGLLNPELARRITLYTGGFPARYGGKLSSSLDIEYAGSDTFEGSASLSLLDGGLAASSTHGPLSWQLGIRKARARRFFATQELKGNYQPDYEDVQGRLMYVFGEEHALEVIGLWASHVFRLDPRGRRTFYGTVAADGGPVDLRSVWINYSNNSNENDSYETGFGGLRIFSQLNSRVRAEHGLSLYRTTETEAYLLKGESVIYDVAADENSDLQMIPRGMARQEDHASNQVDVMTLTGKGAYFVTFGRHLTEVGWAIRRLTFDDDLDERSIVEGRSTEGDLIQVVADSIQGTVALNEAQVSVYGEQVVDLTRRQRPIALTAGVRANRYSFNKEWTLSPRLSLSVEVAPNLTLTGATGVYYQQPTYRELRGTPAGGVFAADHLNRNIRSQRSVQAVLGAELFVPRRRIYLRGEGYWKRLSQVISYSLENVRINYSGENDARGRVYGLDLQARGEFVPGMESWINYSFMVARERFYPAWITPYNSGQLARPTDQRHTVALFVQDYVPSDPSWKLHMRILYGSGLPYTPPRPGDRVGNVVVQLPGARNSARYPGFRRVDFGVTKIIDLLQRSRPVRLEVSAELLNVFDIVNTVAYSWIPDATGIWQRVPTRLTPRTFNIRMRTAF